MADDYDMKDMASWADRQTGGGEGGDEGGGGEQEAAVPTVAEVAEKAGEAKDALNALSDALGKVALPEGGDNADLQKEIDDAKEQATELAPVLESLADGLKAVEGADEEDEGGDEGEGEEEAADGGGAEGAEA